MAELVDALESESSIERCTGSTPVSCTKIIEKPMMATSVFDSKKSFIIGLVEMVVTHKYQFKSITLDMQPVNDKV